MPLPPATPNATTAEQLAAGDVAAALAAAEPTADVILDYDPANSTPLVVVHRDDHVVEQVDLEPFAAEPHRQKGSVTALTADGFIATFEARTVDRGAGSPEAAIYADIDRVELVAVLNDDHENAAGWRDHRITYKPTATPEWLHWVGGQGLGDQERFAVHIEAGENEIVSPSATVMLDIAQTFTASVGAKFRQHGRLRDGRTQLVYEEDVDAKAGDSGEVKIPETFTIGVRPFYGAEPVEVVCRLRYRIRGGSLEIGYTINRPEEIQRASFVADVIEHVAAELPQAPMLHARPAPAR